MICNKCGNNCKDNEKFCGTCGNDLTQQNNMNVVNNSMFNNQIPPVYNQQPMYNSMPNTNPYMYNQVTFQKKKSNVGLIVLIVILLIIVGSVVCVAVFGSKYFSEVVGRLELDGDWYCSKSSMSAAESNPPTHVTYNADGTFVWAKNNDESNNYYRGTYELKKIDKSNAANDTLYYNLILHVKEGKTNGKDDSSYYNKQATYEVGLSSDEVNEDETAAVFAHTNGGDMWYCVKKKNK